METAIITDFLNQFGGAEIVTHEIAKLFPHADIYTMFATEEISEKYFPDHQVIQHPKFEESFLRQKFYRKLFPFYPTYIEDFDLKEYDLIISSSYLWAKGVLCQPDATHISYVHTPIRQAWVKYHDYLYRENDVGKLTRPLLRFVMNYIRLWDIISTNRVDHFIANSSVVKKRIEQIYRRSAQVIHPPIEIKRLKKNISEQKEDYFITIGRLVPYKRVDVMIQAFNQMSDKKLLILGDGNDRDRLSNLVQSSNIELLGFVSEEKKIDLLSKAQAFLFCAEEDFGMSPVEALAMGIPVIGFQQGGTVDYLQDGINGITFSDQNPKSLMNAISKFKEIHFDSRKISASVDQFDTSNFKAKLSEFINEKVGDEVCNIN